MPTTERPADVVFDHDTARRLLDEIRRTIASIGEGDAAWVRASDAAVPDWSGSLARAYRADEPRWRSTVDEVAADLARLAAAVEAGVAAAIADHHRVERLQAAWDAEAARERARRSEAD